MLAALLSLDFPGRSELLEQSKGISARTIDSNGSLALSSDAGPRAEVARRIPAEAEVEDMDGTTVHILLLVLDGRMNELEIYREDSANIQGKIDLERLRLLAL